VRSSRFESNRREDLLLATAEELVRRGETGAGLRSRRATTVQFARVLAQRVQPQALGGAVESYASRRKRTLESCSSR